MAPLCLRSVPRFAVGLALALAFPASAAQAAPARLPTHVACIGDSITAGVGDSTADGGAPKGPYPTQLQSILAGKDPGVVVQNFGHSGATLLSSGDTPYVQQTEYQQATTFVGSLGASAVVDVVIMLGTNDSKPQNWQNGASASEFTSDYVALAQHFAGLAANTKIYLMLPPAAFTNTYAIDGSIIVGQIDPLIENVAAEEGAAVIDLYAPTEGQPQLFDDGVHPSDVGYTLIANTVANALLAPAPADAGPPPPVDSGSPPPIDSGSPPPVDSGSAPVDSGCPPVDSGSPAVDSGSATFDSGSAAPVDSGSATWVDASNATDAGADGCAHQDGGTLPGDSGANEGDDGSAAVPGDAAVATEDSGTNGATAGSAGGGSGNGSGGSGCTVARTSADPMAWPFLALATVAMAAVARRRRRAG